MLRVFQLFFWLVIFFPCLAIAETCPTPKDLQVGNFQHWRIVSLDNASPLSQPAILNFQKQVRTFALAEWMPGAMEGAAHCYYEGEVANSTFLGAFLVKDNIKPGSSAWHFILNNVMQCTLGVSECGFISGFKL